MNDFAAGPQVYSQQQCGAEPLAAVFRRGISYKAWAGYRRDSGDAALVSSPLISSPCMHAVMLCRPRRVSLP